MASPTKSLVRGREESPIKSLGRGGEASPTKSLERGREESPTKSLGRGGEADDARSSPRPRQQVDMQTEVQDLHVSAAASSQNASEGRDTAILQEMTNELKVLRSQMDAITKEREMSPAHASAAPSDHVSASSEPSKIVFSSQGAARAPADSRDFGGAGESASECVYEGAIKLRGLLQSRSWTSAASPRSGQPNPTLLLAPLRPVANCPIRDTTRRQAVQVLERDTNFHRALREAMSLGLGPMTFRRESHTRQATRPAHTILLLANALNSTAAEGRPSTALPPNTRSRRASQQAAPRGRWTRKVKPPEQRPTVSESRASVRGGSPVAANRR